MEFRSQYAEQMTEILKKMEEEKELLLEEKATKGWKSFLFSSSYYGSHDELGEGSIEVQYLFHPKVDFSQWEAVSFSHGHFSQDENNTAFDQWLAGLPTNHYIIL